MSRSAMKAIRESQQVDKVGVRKSLDSSVRDKLDCCGKMMLGTEVGAKLTIDYQD